MKNSKRLTRRERSLYIAVNVGSEQYTVNQKAEFLENRAAGMGPEPTDCQSKHGECKLAARGGHRNGIKMSNECFFRKLASRKLLPGLMDTTMWKIILAILIFADANIAYFEIRRLIQFLRNDSLRKETSQPDNGSPATFKTDFTI